MRNICISFFFFSVSWTRSANEMCVTIDVTITDTSSSKSYIDTGCDLTPYTWIVLQVYKLIANVSVCPSVSLSLSICLCMRFCFFPLFFQFLAGLCLCCKIILCCVRLNVILWSSAWSLWWSSLSYYDVSAHRRFLRNDSALYKCLLIIIIIIIIISTWLRTRRFIVLCFKTL